MDRLTAADWETERLNDGDDLLSELLADFALDVEYDDVANKEAT